MEKCKDHVIIANKPAKKTTHKSMTQVKKVKKSLEPQVSKTENEKEADEALNPSHNEAGDAEDFSDSTPVSFA